MTLNSREKIELRNFLRNARIKKDEELSTMTEKIIDTLRNYLAPVLSMPEEHFERIKYEPRIREIETALNNKDYNSFRRTAYFVMDSLVI